MLLFPNAKINIGLFVTEKRADGFHDIETLFYPIPLNDLLEINPLREGRGECLFESSGIDIEGKPADNLVVKAYALLAERFSLPSVRVHLHKQIPTGAGLGGGSSDAAFMLKGLNELFALGLNEEQLMGYASQLGSDCAFFIRNLPVFARGRGEVMEPVALSLKGYHVVLVKPCRGVSTAEAYRAVSPRAAGMDLRRLADLPVEQWKEKVVNVFEESVISKVPEIGEIKTRLEALGACYVAMTGSGSAVYALFERAVAVAELFPGYFVWDSEGGVL